MIKTALKPIKVKKLTIYWKGKVKEKKLHSGEVKWVKSFNCLIRPLHDFSIPYPEASPSVPAFYYFTIGKMSLGI